jgi:EF hand
MNPLPKVLMVALAGAALLASSPAQQDTQEPSADQLMQRFDADGNGMLDRGEFRRLKTFMDHRGGDRAQRSDRRGPQGDQAQRPGRRGPQGDQAQRSGRRDQPGDRAQHSDRRKPQSDQAQHSDRRGPKRDQAQRPQRGRPQSDRAQGPGQGRQNLQKGRRPQGDRCENCPADRGQKSTKQARTKRGPRDGGTDHLQRRQRGAQPQAKARGDRPQAEQRGRQRPDREQMKRQILKKFDRDGDGKLNEGERAEARRAMQARRGGGGREGSGY